MQSHDLTRKAEADAGAFLLGREEWDEDLVLTFLADWMSVVGHVDDDVKIDTNIVLYQVLFWSTS